MSDSPSTQYSEKRPWWMLAIWFGLVSLGFAGLGAYGITPGEIGETPEQWPVDVPRQAGPTILCFVHPKCPCSRATLAELHRLQAKLPDSARLEFVLFQPEGAEAFWGDEPWKELHALSSRERSSRPLVRLDPGGALALKFGAVTSGMILAYRESGELCFEGGITATRGHEGPSPAQDWLASAFAPGPQPTRQQAPVFGCPILELEGGSVAACCDPQESNR